MYVNIDGMKWPHISSIFLVVVVFFLFSSLFSKNEALAQTTVSPTSSAFLTYDNSTSGIKMQYPSNWLKLDLPILSKIRENNTQNVALFYSPDCSVGVNIRIEKLQSGTTLNQYINTYIDEARKNNPDIRIVESKNITHGGLPSHRIVSSGLFDIQGAAKRLNIQEILGYTINLKPINATGMENIVLYNDKAYLVGYSDSSGKGMDQISHATSSLFGGGSFDVCNILGMLSHSSPGMPGGLSSPGSPGPFGDLLKGLSNSSTGVIPQPTSNDLKNKYSQYLPTALKMFDSFQITSNGINNSGNVSPKPVLDQCQNLKAKLDTRLVNGEINTQQYDAIKQKIGC
jgi:PsbP-like protein